MNAYLLLPEAFALRYSSISGNTVAFGLMSSTPCGTCPLCSRDSHKVHRYYQRKVGDLPISGRTVKLYISTRKFSVKWTPVQEKYSLNALVPA